ncbi:hypothetical protein Acsp04_43810 [Actinomadura sp. NBRC 104425]|uniref:outer membrane protein assembly factor BamB family protein n=1 Tax=Actinomadura sp. NBRC 104425 TaxID=3032204 RepID=UPI0024A5A4E3|nr:PQQ-binding-like beta-propeller repeat protein [Actinomadura sp. NBRC 104425]GLZ14146.1 hypothetical protein Acsp04_43810 [Actinomadura sp. NBRC 104425]
MPATRPGDPRQVGPYRVVARLGAGGMGQVFLGRSPSGRTVAIKIIHPGMAEEPAYRARFQREIIAARAVSGAYTAPVVDADPDADPPWLATVFLRGMPLQDAVATHGPLPAPAVRALGAGLAEALLSIHRAGVVHRDLKPSNVMLTPEGPRVIDFGIARPSEATTLTRTGAALGTPAYMSPEQASGEEAGPASDVFSLGGVLTYAATGMGPFGQAAVHELLYRVLHLPPYLDGVADPGLRALIAACLEKDPARRPGPDWLLARLAAEQAPAPQGTHWLPPHVAHDVVRRGDTAVPRAPSRRLFLALGGGGVAVAALAGAAGVLLLRRGDSPVRWTFEIPDDMNVRAPLAVADGTVYAFTAAALSGRTFALDARTGRQRWRGDFTAARDTPAVLVNGRGFVCASSGGDQVLTAFDAATGRSLWRQTVRNQTQVPAIVPVGGVVCMTYNGAGEAGLSGFDAASGREAWRYRVDSEVMTNAAVAGGVCYFGARDGFVYGVDAATGSARWQRRTGAAVGATPAAAGGLVAVLGEDGAVRGLDAATGKQRWETALGSGAAARMLVEAPVTIIGGIVYVGGQDGTLYAVDAGTGRLRWRQPVLHGQGNPGSRAFLQPSVSGGLVVTTDNEGRIVALDAASGRLRWELGVGQGLGGRPIVSGALVYYGAVDGLTVADLASGRVRYRFDPETAPVVGSVKQVTVVGGIAYCAVDDSVVHAVRPDL